MVRYKGGLLQGMCSKGIDKLTVEIDKNYYINGKVVFKNGIMLNLKQVSQKCLTANLFLQNAPNIDKRMTKQT